MQTSNSNYFDRLAGVYDLATAKDGAWTPPKVVAGVAKSYLTSASTVLDVGVGTGLCLTELRSHIAEFEAWGVDSSPAMLERCAAKFPEVKLIQGDIGTVAATTQNYFDLIIASGITEFVEDLGSWLDSARNILKETGILVFTFELLIPNHPVQGTTKSLVVPDPQSTLFYPDFYTFRRPATDVCKMLEDRGFRILDQEIFTAYRKLDADIQYGLIVATLQS